MQTFLGKLLRVLPAAITWPFIRLIERFLELIIYETSYQVRSFSEKRRPSTISREVAKAITSPDDILMVTMTRSGTHWLGYLISNYISYLISGHIDKYNNQETMDYVFHNSMNGILWLNSKFKDKPVGPRNLIKRNYFYTHIRPAAEHSMFFLGKRILLFRNPRDWAVSRHDNMSNRADIKYPGGKINNYIDTLMTEYCESMLSLKAVFQTDKDILISYEELSKDTSATLRRVVNFLGLPIDERAIKYSLERSSSKTIMEQENQGMVISSALENKSFVNNPTVGKWKSILNTTDIKRINSYLKNYGLKSSEFTYE